jgi:hypothetical protein
MAISNRDRQAGRPTCLKEGLRPYVDSRRESRSAGRRAPDPTPYGGSRRPGSALSGRPGDMLNHGNAIGPPGARAGLATRSTLGTRAGALFPEPGFTPDPPEPGVGHRGRHAASSPGGVRPGNASIAQEQRRAGRSRRRSPPVQG